VIGSRPEHWDSVFDVVVVGSGGAGLVAATLAHDGGAQVIVLEKAPLIGGTTGVSGGVQWIPMNHHMGDVGETDSREEALTYIRRVTLGREPDADLLEVYVDTAPEMLEYLEAKTPLRMAVPRMFNDYYAQLPGGKRRGRSIEPAPFDARSELGDEAVRLRTSPHLPWLTLADIDSLGNGESPDGDHFGSQTPGRLQLEAIATPGRTVLGEVGLAAKRQAEDVRVLGAAMVAALYKGLRNRNVDVLTNAAVQDLVVVDGEVIGVAVENSTGRQLIGARKGVVLACGGFEWNESMVKAFIGLPISAISPPFNEGDGHRMAMEAGAELANMTSFWGIPVVMEPGFVYDGREMAQMGTARGLAGAIVVNRLGHRFVNEGVTYRDFPKVLNNYDPVSIEYPNEGPNWILFDQRLKDTSVILPTIVPGQPAPDWIAQAPTLRELAVRIGVDPDALEATVSRWNENVAAGEDRDYRRGTTYFEVLGSGNAPTPGAVMAPIDRAPFYAVELLNGAIGTNGGPRIDRDARVRRARGGVVPGLYAAGNASASVWGLAYPGGGATIGPAATFGYIAGRHAASQPSREI